MNTNRPSLVCLVSIALVFLAGCEKSPSTAGFGIGSSPAAPSDSAAKGGEGKSIRVLSGRLIYDGADHISIELKGTHGLRAEIVVRDPIAGFGPRSGCIPCEPGDRVRLDAALIDSSISGTVRLQGTEYRLGTGPSDPTAHLEFFGEGVVLPPIAAQGVDLTAPFEFAGGIFVPEEDGTTSHQEFTGQGVATVRFAVFDLGLGFFAWRTAAAVYEFAH